LAYYGYRVHLSFHRYLTGVTIFFFAKYKVKDFVFFFEKI